jgi:hypothetical protein
MHRTRHKRVYETGHKALRRMSRISYWPILIICANILMWLLELLPLYCCIIIQISNNSWPFCFSFDLVKRMILIPVKMITFPRFSETAWSGHVMAVWPIKCLKCCLCFILRGNLWADFIKHDDLCSGCRASRTLWPQISCNMLHTTTQFGLDKVWNFPPSFLTYRFVFSIVPKETKLFVCNFNHL